MTPTSHSPVAGRSGDPVAINATLVAIVGRASAVDLRDLERASSAEIWDALGASVQDILRDSLDVLGRVLERYDGGAAEAPIDDSTGATWDAAYNLDIDTLLRQHPTRGRIADLAFMGRLELRERFAAVTRLNTGTHSARTLLARLDGACRAARKSLTAISTMLASVEGIKLELSFSYELETSLKVRCAYARLRGSIGDRDELSDEEILPRLRGIGTRIAMLVGRSLYQDLRIDDRFELRALQERILAWLRSDTSTSLAQRDARRLWQDIAGFGRVLALVSHRQELLQHDARIITIATGLVSRNEPDKEVPAGLLERLHSLMGLDDEIDALISDGATHSGAWRAPLQRLNARFGQTNPPQDRPASQATYTGDTL